MLIFALAGILLPLLGSLLVLIVPRAWIKWFSTAITLLAVLSTLGVLIDLAGSGRAGYSVDVFWVGGILVYGILVDKVSTLISSAFILVGLLILI